MTERLHVRILFAPDDDEDAQTLAASQIKRHESLFLPFLDRHIKEDARYTFLVGSLDVPEVQISGSRGYASITFTSDFYAGCRDQNDTEDHEAGIDFEIQDGHMIFDIQLPPRWVIED